MSNLDIELNRLLRNATKDELLGITKLIDEDEKEPYLYEDIVKEIASIGGNSTANCIRGFSFSKLIDGDILDAFNSKGVPYLEILNDLVDELDIDIKELGYSSKREDNRSPYLKKNIIYMEKIENCITQIILKQKYENMTEEEKKIFQTNMNEILNKSQNSTANKYILGAGSLTLANMGGFATYTLLTTTMSTLSFGALGFGAYTAMTTALSVAIGPIGWMGLGAASIYNICSSNTKKLIPIVILLGAIRQRLNIKENDLENQKLLKKELLMKSLADSFNGKYIR